MKTHGNAVAGTSYTDTHPNLPRAGENLGHGHRPWCTDCKRKHDPDQLDDDQRCPKCATAAVRRAEAAARRAEDGSDAIWEQALAEHQGKTRRTSRRTTTKLPTEGKQGQPTTRRSAPRATQASSTTGRAPIARPSTTEKKPSSRTPAGDAPRQDLGEALADLEANDPQVADAVAAYDEAVDRIAHPADHLQAPRETAERLNALIDRLADTRARHLHELAQIEIDLHRLHQLLHTPTPAPVPAPERGAHGQMVLPDDEIATAYRAGASLRELAATYGCSTPTIRRRLVAVGTPLRPRGGHHPARQNHATIEGDNVA